MKTLLLCLTFMSLHALASAEADSEALSQSFNTTPLGRTQFGYKTVSHIDEEKHKEDQNAQLLACKQDPNLCPKEEAPVQKKTTKKNMIGKALELTEK